LARVRNKSNAAFVGANTVLDPGFCRVASNPVRSRAICKVDRLGLFAMISAMVPSVSGALSLSELHERKIPTDNARAVKDLRKLNLNIRIRIFISIKVQ
jgi:hypothetical protein